VREMEIMINGNEIDYGSGELVMKDFGRILPWLKKYMKAFKIPNVS
jgi:hypothetical protein